MHGEKKVLVFNFMRRAALALVGVLAVSAVSIPHAWAQDAADDAGDVQTISTLSDLQAFRDSVNAGDSYEGKTVRLASDIDLSGVNWTPIGESIRSGSGVSASSHPFKGTFDGAGHTISGLGISPVPGIEYGHYAVGLFGAVMGGTVKDLTIANAKVDVPASELCGICAGLMSGGTISNVAVGGTVKALCGTGGVVGRMTLTGGISNCTNNASIATTGGSGNTGGIVGAAYYTTPGGDMRIDGCANHGTVSGTNDTGGIVGLCAGFVSDCTNDAAVSGSGYALGGIAAELKNYGGVVGCSNSAEVKHLGDAGNIYGTGGIVGWLRYDGQPPAYAKSAMIYVSDNSNSGNIAGSNDAGGIVGTVYSSAQVTDNENTAPSISSSQFAGGIVGNIQLQDGALPSGISNGITVENNVSTTAISAISAPLKNAIAYNNIGDVAAIDSNGTKWAAEVGNAPFVNLSDAIADAAGGDDGNTVRLLSDISEQPAVDVDSESGQSVELDLNGHSIGFAPEGEFIVTGGTFVVKGDGSVTKPNAGSRTGSALFSVVPESGKTAAVELQGGSYSSDVSRYVDDGYSELVKDADAANGRYQVLTSADAKDGAKADVTVGSHTVYYQNADEATRDAAAIPGAKVTVYGQTPDAGDNTHDSGNASGAQGDTANANNGAGAGNTSVRRIAHQVPIPPSAANTGNDLARTDDHDTGDLLLGLLVLVALSASAMAVMAVSRKTSKR